MEIVIKAFLTLNTLVNENETIISSDVKKLLDHHKKTNTKE